MTKRPPINTTDRAIRASPTLDAVKIMQIKPENEVMTWQRKQNLN